MQPNPCRAPVALDRGRRDAERLGGLLGGQPAEVPQLDQPRQVRVLPREVFERLVERDEVVAQLGRLVDVLVQLQLSARARGR